MGSRRDQRRGSTFTEHVLLLDLLPHLEGARTSFFTCYSESHACPIHPACFLISALTCSSLKGCENLEEHI